MEYFTIILEPVKVASCPVDLPNVRDLAGEQLPQMEEYSFVYGKVTWTFTDGTLEHTDDWIAAR